jgi:hypothetical protein
MDGEVTCRKKMGFDNTPSNVMVLYSNPNTNKDDILFLSRVDGKE